MGLDVGTDSIKTFSEALDTSKTVIWNGPMGVFEFEKFAAGTDVSIISRTSIYLSAIILWLLSIVCLSSGNCEAAG
jgi:3-phosphoglycerate kinase